MDRRTRASTAMEPPARYRGKWLAGFAAFASIAVATTAPALTLDDLTNKETVAALREALIQGASHAAENLGKLDGFLGNPKVKIPLPQSLHRVESVMRTMGMGDQADELITTLNRAAEAAVPEAKSVLISAAKKMSAVMIGSTFP